MAEFWLIAVPTDKISSQSLEKLKRATNKASLGNYFRFHIPELKVGSLDVLLSVSDDLSRLDSYTEGVLRKTTQCMADLMEQSESSDKLMENALANGDFSPEPKAFQKVSQSPKKMFFQALRVNMTTYTTKFQWDRAKYATALPLKTLYDLIFKQVAQVETEMKSRNAAFNEVKLKLQSLDKKAEESLHTRPLTGIVKKEDLVLNSEYLTTLLVVVPRKLLEEEDAGIFTVTLFKNTVNEFKANAKKHKFVVREFNIEEAEKQQQEIRRLKIDKKDQYGVFVRWLKVNINEVFVAWIHIKAIRVFVESVLRYGLPVSFQTLLLQPQKKHVKRLREELNSVFKHLDPMAMTGKSELGLDFAEVNIGQQEYYSYIYYPISINIVESS
ncbi:V-type proton ATPase subunit C 1-A isoform X2 [Silurus meridionalis]|uniref:V-type proton ATPase subunit C 1-A isoform X2 n=1 Tax=Silurus meridionalis TaxID=175797 RepID=UPI001EEC766C|nr:V-type proton ATPase subunit C 1-A isoform X2 [Silurus meridionalis]